MRHHSQHRGTAEHDADDNPCPCGSHSIGGRTNDKQDERMEYDCVVDSLRHQGNNEGGKSQGDYVGGLAT